MDFYKSTLNAMYKLLNDAGVKFWAEWILKDVEDWEESKLVEHHLSAYGGMGSLNDVVICVQNNHKVKKEQEAWINTLLSSLKAISFYLAKSPKDKININDIKKSLKYNYVKIQGTRCLNCGYSELSLSDIDNFIAPKIIDDEIVDALMEDRLISFVDNVINLNLPQIIIEREKIEKIICESNISFTKLNRWMRPCPECGSDDTAVYRWNMIKKKNIFMKEVQIFEPSNDNLCLKY